MKHIHRLMIFVLYLTMKFMLYSLKLEMRLSCDSLFFISKLFPFNFVFKLLFSRKRETTFGGANDKGAKSSNEIRFM
jgi:hypothetical protein